jgi:hypothetical protein
VSLTKHRADLILFRQTNIKEGEVMLYKRCNTGEPTVLVFEVTSELQMFRATKDY